MWYHHNKFWFWYSAFFGVWCLGFGILDATTGSWGWATILMVCAMFNFNYVVENYKRITNKNDE